MEQSLQVLGAEQRLIECGARVSACRSSGKTAKTWCAENAVQKLIRGINRIATPFSRGHNPLEEDIDRALSIWYHSS